MSRTSIPVSVRLKLWIKSGGRCQFRGCNKLLYRDDLTQTERNSSYFAHIVADSPGGVRGDKELSFHRYSYMSRKTNVIARRVKLDEATS